MRILFLGNANNPLLINLAIELKKFDSQVIVDFVSEVRVTNSGARIAFDKIYEVQGGTFFRKIPILKTMWMMAKFRATLKQVTTRYDFVHMFFMHIGYSKSLDLIRSLAPKFIVSVFGSELYRSAPVVLKALKPLAKMAHVVTAANESTLRDFVKKFEIENHRTCIRRFGLSPLSTIRNQKSLTLAQHKKAIGFSENNFVITCGYNSSPGQQHETIIRSLQKVKSQLPANYVLVFPIGMGGTVQYKESIVSLLSESGLNYFLIDKFLSEEDLAHLRAGTDIMIQVQKTDQLSGAMQEHLFAGNLVITGSWLPYAVFKDAGIKYWEVDSPEDVGSKVLELTENAESLKSQVSGNSQKIWELSSWERNAEQWYQIYDEG